ncbi:chromosomal replication initiation ATPase DnaA [Sagittula marina]|uniref:Chromosomal replication initiation ATPase DnaA n=1 Tax=Sagittula marina TaxID=943940 RepID=A0A7W6DU76_9RHOB|nr:helix-turn-helix domain-containing protein [Sagittula marina]MBB3986158.1 chromosomal replication initiation ATPase DnaA [Sagittula marina]
MDLIVRVVADVWGVPVADILGPKKFPMLVRPRFAVILLAQRLTEFSLAETARFLKRDHTSGVNGKKRAEHFEATSIKYAARMRQAERLLRFSTGPVVFVRSPSRVKAPLFLRSSSGEVLS